ncbi:cobalamin biosynthesis protein CobQ [Amylibacter sp. SFDW26]|uniref:cobalamin biosynthesis protein CobQ n=1 Tax=Amylibacter sp. SFDW26 TaxID=2652722 RepID=UPI0012624F1D|nr:cobalamin biosynthesis protein CobQ [Amylibacter sp. SFDW26]KAB7616195.1 cobalamin biosynthesis protein CobQ [Amylibacter sp. SFDW26]
MNTPAHLLFAAGVFAKPDSPKITTAAMIGGLLPDLSLYIMASYSILILGNNPTYVFDVQYFSPLWQQTFAVDNSFVLWGIIFATAIWVNKKWLMALSGAALLHVAFDFPLHHDDARQHFWPVTDWVFYSPYSYWDSNHHGGIISTIEQILVVSAWILLWRRFKSIKMRALFTAIALMQTTSSAIFSLMF